MLSRVVLPAPFGPITDKISPCSTSRLTCVTAWTPPNAFETSRISSSALIRRRGPRRPPPRPPPGPIAPAKPALERGDADTLLADEGEHLLGGDGDGGVHRGELRLLEGRQHVVRDPRLRVRAPDAHLDAPDLRGAEARDHRLHAVVAAGAALHADPHRAEGQIDVVVDEDEVGGPGAHVA